ncbi:MAG: phage tail protein [Deltaproteobacteria bacterium CG_4_10_14_0_2_um_filter_43_8]|nr:MAG: phage tail protein [Deltaproteobacteria bacterium CG11_big_fil_rev_8_21_14_0_20_42_23]PJA20528.1 MAG: phage tail protein [Deltaproteobacteria bacterium CG_4_10_14_0_2_um_filter_43_8]PJC65039.1 MAG: phage tail protein [Deltaproteobacteria bacterium CG_4_9_14_0_2_um_filter_42_21]
MRINGESVHDLAFFSGIEPDPELTVSEWADKYRKLSQKASSEPGTWRTARTPYLREIMDELSPYSSSKEIVFMKGAQIGGTEAGNNWIGFVIDYAPGPMLAVQPTVEMAKRNSKQRIEPLIEESSRLRSKVRNPRSRDSGNTILSKEFPGGVLVMTGANSAVGLRSLPAKNVFLDEVDAYPGDVDGEGDPVALAKARTRTFARKKIFMVSTPTIEGRSRIESAYENTDMRKYHVPCPECNEYQSLKWSQVKWPKGEPEKAYYSCEICGHEIYEHKKSWMLEHGKWIAENPGNSGKNIAGFHLSSLYSPVGWFSWADAAILFQEAKQNQEKLRVFVNTVLGETWKERGESPDWRRLYERRETYKIGTVPKNVVFLTAGADVQKDRIEVEVVGWAEKKISWSIDYRVYMGDTSSDEVWFNLDHLLNESFMHETGVNLQIRMLAVDSGYNTQMVYDWVRRQPLSKVMCVKGNARQQIILAHPKSVDVTKRGKTLRRGVRLWPVGVDTLKHEIYGYLRQPKPLEGESTPFGYCHFPEYGEEYFMQLTAEEIVIRIHKGFKKLEWQKIRDRNEALDCRVYNRAAAAFIGIDRFADIDWQRMRMELGVKTKQVSSENIDTSKKTDGFWKQRKDFWS